MKILEAAVFPAFVLLLAAAMVCFHWRSWRVLKDEIDPADPDEYDYRYRQCRRRLQASALLGVVGVALFVGQLINPRLNPSSFVYFWIGVVLLVAWIVLLALADIVATRMRNSRLEHERLVAAARLQALSKQKREASRNGAEKGGSAPGDKDELK